jgi:hypothetical protein
VTTKVLQKAVWAGSNNGSYPLAGQALEQLAGVQLSLKQVRRWVKDVGEARITEREAAIEQLRRMPLSKRRQGSRASDPPELAVISMDGGRYQRRDNFRSKSAPKIDATHWRETKVGCLLSMRSKVYDHDPTPEFPEWLATSRAIAELAHIAEKPGRSKPERCDEQIAEAAKGLLYQPPQLVSREVIASGQEAESFGWHLESRAWQLGFPAAQRQAFISDGAQTNWSIQRKHFPQAEPILDLMHALSYAWSAAAASGRSYRRWAAWIWQGKVAGVLAELEQQQQLLGAPPPDAAAHDPRELVQRALTYFRNNQARMKYPKYRQLGLPLTSSHIESTVKQINHRIKGSEKFWRRDSGDAVLQLRADSLSDSQPLTAFWRRWQAQQTGANRYRLAA